MNLSILILILTGCVMIGILILNFLGYISFKKESKKTTERESFAEQAGTTLGKVVRLGQKPSALFIWGLILWAVGVGMFVHGLFTPYYEHYYPHKEYRNTVEIAVGAGLSIIGFGLTAAGGIMWHKRR
ncbi:hypothetical protein [Dehalococcoides mccartyi]|uniref:hypothetical protein n=1 Tax=Dehalococcoides mccartyi TaxID=61435 RepID=UPI0019EAF908|nr:hypothetical protein [Dehalococcoides mccartyi]MBF4481855.1 hypothetical protein [Dehalococcoides mccartyi]MBJ7531211.1 hypothetical protein [Dehalococcoides mccartyi]